MPVTPCRLILFPSEISIEEAQYITLSIGLPLSQRKTRPGYPRPIGQVDLSHVAIPPPLWTLNAMPTHPIPPAIPGNRAEYEAQYAKDPDRWYQYLSEAYAWMAAQEEGQTATDRKLIELQVQVEAQQEEILNLQNIIQTMQVEKSAAMMQKSWIEDRLDKKEKELEIAQGKACKAQEEARQAVAARLPTVATLTPVTSDPDAKARIAETMETPSPPATQSAASAQLSERIPDPDKFKATRADLRRFCDAVTEKLSLNRDRYPTPISRMGYVNSRLNDDAYKLIQPYIRHGICRLPDYTDILDILQGAYGDPNAARTARRKLDTLRQGNRDFFSFHAEFQSLALEGGIEGDALAPFLEKAVSKELSEMLLYNPPADYSYQTLVSHFRGLDIRLQEHRERTRPYISRKPTTTAYVRPTYIQTTRQERKSSSPRRGRSPPERAQPSGDPMDLSNQRRYQRPSYRRENNQCFRCGSSTHYIRDCPEPDTRPAKFRHAAITYSPRHPSRQESPKSPTSSRSDSRNSQIYQENGASLS
ncbi:Biofilm regulator 1 [Fusarium oxysporum f. sp. albedinis]|nr:Biofilm regulator 1 [Fusarium oxysporum f. sp. albedinis]